MPSLGSDLDHAHHSHDRGGRHEAVGVERDGEFVLAAPALAEVPEIAGLEAGVDGAAAVGDRHAAAPLRGERGEAAILQRRDVVLAGVAQDVEVERARGSGGVDLAHHGVEIADHPVRRLVADEDRDRGRGGDRLVAAQARDRRQHGRDRIAGEPHDEEADGRVPEPDHRPGHGETEEEKEKSVGNAEPAGRQRVGRERQQDRDGDQHEGCKQRPASDNSPVRTGT